MVTYISGEQTLSTFTVQLAHYMASEHSIATRTTSPTSLLAARSGYHQKKRLNSIKTTTRVVPKVMSNFFFLHANWEQQTESAVVDGTSCCVILECLMTSVACIT